MRSVSLGAGLLCLCLLVPAAWAGPELLTDGGFETGTAGNNFNGAFSTFVPTSGPFGIWMDVNQWQYASGGVGGSLFASHVTKGDNTNLLFQGVDVSGGLPGSALTLSFDYVFAGGSSNRDVWVLGLTGATETVSKFANFFPSGNSDSPPGDVLLHLTDTELVTTADWKHLSFDLAAAGSYDALLVGFKFSSGSSSADWSKLRGVDNVSLTATPEPALPALLLLGAAALGWHRRRRRA